MNSWSLESAFVRAYSLAAVGVQGVIDTLTRRPGHDWDFPIPGCPDAGECRTYGCAGDCSEAAEADAHAMPASAVVSRNEPAERPPEVDHSPDPSGGHLTWVDWATPAICTVLDQHQPHPCIGTSELLNCGQHPGYYSDRQAWLEHVAPLIAVHLESALAHEFPASK